jgi:flagellar biosynthesis/type III secretory pathway M-ring protein FliF/YscJ
MQFLLGGTVAVSTEEEWEPALGTYGWLWVTLAGIAVFVGYKFVQRRIDQAAERRRHEERWGQRPEETEEQWQLRVQRQKEDDLKQRQEWEARERARARQQATRRSRGSVYNSRGDFDPPGGWGAMGPDNG